MLNKLQLVIKYSLNILLLQMPQMPDEKEIFVSGHEREIIQPFTGRNFCRKYVIQNEVNTYENFVYAAYS